MIKRGNPEQKPDRKGGLQDSAARELSFPVVKFSLNFLQHRLLRFEPNPWGGTDLVSRVIDLRFTIHDLRLTRAHIAITHSLD